jgi:acyl-CoA thioesterase-1
MTVRGSIKASCGIPRFVAALLVIAAVAGFSPGTHAAAVVAATDDRPRIVAFGDSLTAGLGVAAEDAYPSQLQRRLDRDGFRYRVINAGVSGDTTAGGVRRMTWVLKSRPQLVILELGGNDGLRGLSLRETKANLERIIQQCRSASVTVVLAGMKLPPNYGVEYTNGFESMYPALAEKYHLVLIPFFLDGVAGSTSLNQADGIHPTAEGYRIIVDKVLETVRPLLEQAK